MRRKSLVDQNFNYAISIKQESNLFSLFVPGLSISKNSMLHGSYSSATNNIALWGSFPMISTSKNKIMNLNIELVMPADTSHTSSESDSGPLNLLFRSRCDKFSFSDSVWMLEPVLNIRASKDSVRYSFMWDNKSLPAYRGEIVGYLKLHNTADKNNFGIEMGIDESDVIITDSVWTIADGNVFLFDSTSLDIVNFVIRNGPRTINISGRSSKANPGSINVEMSNFDLRIVNPFMTNDNLTWGGSLSGMVKISDVFVNPYVTGDLTIHRLQLNERDLGEAAIRSNWNNTQKKINVQATIKSGTLNTVLLDGNYYLNPQLLNKSDALDFNINLNRFRVSVFEPFITNIFSEIADQGAASGNLKLTGSFKNPNLVGSLEVSKVGVKVDFLNTQYNFADKVVFTEEWIGFDDVIINDLKGNRAIAKGRIYHDHLKNFRLDIEVKQENLYTLNTNQNQNKLYYGKAYTSGDFKITGTPKQINLDLALTTQRGTQFFISLNTDDEISMGGFIRFENPADTVSGEAGNTIIRKLEKLPELNFDLQVTKDADIELIFDETAGDILKAKGNGNLKLQVDHASDFKIYGEYVIEAGDYLFTLQSVINKRFKIKRGGTIQWSGNPYNAVIDIEAVYGLTASLYDLTLNQEDRRRVPVDCILRMKGNLMNPEITFDIEFPNIEDGAGATSLLAATTEQQLNKQMFSLLVLGQFQPLEGGGLETSGGVGANTSELLSNQLSNWLSKISEDFDIGVNYRPGDELTSEELEVALSTQLFDDRLSINGSVANNPNDGSQNSSNIVGDFNLDYKITKDGQLKIKAFNHSNDSYLATDNAPYTQGIGFSYSREFNTLKDLFRRKNKKQKMKSESPDNK
ncbi:MAG TPA: translocation/assembly module TamB [Flavobacteriales bacterium]|nr:translocation/assembly module TamB [Flavobacteriales bacterium]